MAADKIADALNLSVKSEKGHLSKNAFTYLKSHGALDIEGIDHWYTDLGHQSAVLKGELFLFAILVSIY